MTYDAANRRITFNGEEVIYDADGNMTYGPVDGEITGEYVSEEYAEKVTYNTYETSGNTMQEHDVRFMYNGRFGVMTDENRLSDLFSKGSVTETAIEQEVQTQDIVSDNSGKVSLGG